MRALLVAAGGRGKVEPFVALAQGLRTAGHDAVVAAPKHFARLAATAGVGFAGLDDSLVTEQERLDAAGVGASRTPYLAEPALRRWLAGLSALVDLNPDVVVYAQGAFGAPAIAEKRRVPLLPAQFTPTAPATSEFAAPSAPLWMPRGLRRRSWKSAGAIQRRWRSVIARWKAERLGLPAQCPDFAQLVADHGVLSAWSRHFLPAPADWPPEAAPLGFWTRPESSGTELPEDVRQFLTEGAPPVLFVLDDLYGADTKRLARAITAGLRLVGRRGLIIARKSGLTPGPISEDLHLANHLSFPTVMPHIAAVVHHGTISTIAVALTAGVPQVTQPSFEDQLFWASRLHHLGLAPEPLDRLSSQSLADALEDAIDLRPAVERVQTALKDEDGIAAAVTRIERAAGNRIDASDQST